jgi:transposase, IS30 family
MGVRWSRMSWSERNELWARWRRGEALREIAHGLRRASSVIFTVVAAEGGIPPRPRRRSRLALTATDREEISRQLACGQSLRAISRLLGRAPSTLSREVARNGGRSVYRAAVADGHAWRRTRRPQRCRLSTHPALRHMVARKLAQQWSPQQISGWLRCTFPSDADMHVSPETIYRSLFVQSRGVLRRCLLKQLRRQHHFRHARAGARVHPRQGQILDAVSIRQRPAEVQDRAVPGHWEGDLLEGARGTYIATLVERQSRYVMLVRLPRKDTDTVTRAIARRIRRLPHGLMKSLTWDRGGEFAAHRAFSVATNVNVYFCDPRSPWQRGSNENTNGLLRQYLPTATNLSGYSQAQLDTIALRVNTRPRMTLGYQTPAAKLAEIVAATG